MGLIKMGDFYDRLDLENQLFMIDLYELREQYDKKMQKAKQYNLIHLAELYREVFITCKNMIDRFDEEVM